MITKEILKPNTYNNKVCKNHALIYIFSGQAFLTINRQNSINIAEGYFTILPKDAFYKIESSVKTTYLTIILKNINDLAYFERDVFENMPERLSFEPEKKCFLIPYSFRGNYLIEYFMTSVHTYINKGMPMNILSEVKIKELFCLLSISYPADILKKLFMPLHAVKKDTAFRKFILENYHNFNTVREFAEAMNYSYSGFSKKFKQLFGVSAYHWMKEQKARRIYTEIVTAESPLKEVSYNLGFSSISNFYKFCKSNFGKTPGELRYGSICSFLD